MAFATDKICRTCMAESSALMPIWPTMTNAVIDPASSIAMMLKSFTTIEALPGDGLPEQLCITCVSELNRTYSFKQKCERSEYTLRMYLSPIIRADAAASVDVDEPTTLLTVPTASSMVYESKMMMPAKTNVVVIVPRKQLPTVQLPTQVEPANLVYQCDTCSITFLSYETLKQHLIGQHNAHHCDQCNKYFNAEAYLAHIKTHAESDAIMSVTDPKRKFACEICSLDFASKEVFDDHCLKFHMVEEPYEVLNDDVEESNVFEEIGYEHYEELETITEADDEVLPLVAKLGPIAVESPPDKPKEDKFFCSHCNAAFAKRLSLNIHFSSRKCMQKSFECDICSRVFARKKNLLTHMKLHSSQQSDLACSRCDLKFTPDEGEQFEEHEKACKPSARKHKCPECPKAFGMASTLKDHLRTHSGERPFLCAVCGKGFTQNANLRQHLMRHNKTKPFKCNDCGYAFVSKGELDAHERKHTGQHPFVCGICSAGFTTSSSLVKHKRIHTGERPYACEHCPMRFSALATLKNHRRTHTGERPFKCTICAKSFTQKNDCAIHMRTHTGERPYSCLECGQMFSYASALKTHMKSHRNAAKVVVQVEATTATIEQTDSLIDVI